MSDPPRARRRRASFSAQTQTRGRPRHGFRAARRSRGPPAAGAEGRAGAAAAPSLCPAARLSAGLDGAPHLLYRYSQTSCGRITTRSSM